MQPNPTKRRLKQKGGFFALIEKLLSYLIENKLRSGLNMILPDKNEIFLSGTITRKNRYKNLLFVSVTTGTYIKNGNRCFTNPTVLFAGDLSDQADNFPRGALVDIKASVVTRRIRGDLGGSRYSQSINGTSISPSKSILEQSMNIEGISAPAPSNRVVLCGRVYSIRASETGPVKIGISTTTVINGRRMHSIIMCSYFTSLAQSVLEDIHVRDRVCAAGSIQTYISTRDEKSSTKNMIVLTELQKL